MYIMSKKKRMEDGPIFFFAFWEYLYIQCSPEATKTIDVSFTCSISPNLSSHVAQFLYSWSISHILEHEFFCLGRLAAQGSKEKSGFEIFWATFESGFFQLFKGKKNLIFFWKYFSVNTKKLHKMKLIFFFLKIWLWILYRLPLTFLSWV